jgi:hypothetical protein
MAAIPVNAREIAGIPPKNLRVSPFWGFCRTSRQLQRLSEGAGAVRLVILALPPMSSGRSYHHIYINAVVRISPRGRQFSYDSSM